MSIERNIAIDYAKGVGILLVVYGHVTQGLLNARFQADRGLHELINSVIYSFHMPLFFFLSGIFFLGSLAKHGGKKLIENKLETIFYPYIVWSMIQGLIEVALSGYTNGTATLGQVLSLLWLPRAQFWFLYTLFFIYLVSVALYRRSGTYRSATMLLLATLLFVLRPFSTDIYPILSFGNNFVFFALGASANSLLLSRGNTNQPLLPLMFLLATATFAGSQYLLIEMSGHEVSNLVQAIRLLLACFGIALIITLCRLLARFELRWLEFLGRHSMEIYLVHTLGSASIRIVLNKFLGITDFGLHVALGMLFGVGAPLLLVSLARKYSFGWLFAPPRKLFAWAKTP